VKKEIEDKTVKEKHKHFFSKTRLFFLSHFSDFIATRQCQLPV
jgi:hypothetical protein